MNPEPRKTVRDCFHEETQHKYESPNMGHAMSTGWANEVRYESWLEEKLFDATGEIDILLAELTEMYELLQEEIRLSNVKATLFAMMDR